MKKWIALAALTLALATTNVQAQQGGGDPAAMLARMKERVKPELVEKAKLTDAQADKVVEIQFESRQQMRGFRDLPEDERKKKTEAIQADLDKKYKAIPLTDEQIKAINAYYEEMRRNFQQRQGGGRP
jgi:Spy/CpxP family protein refolding chaperone